MTTRPWPIRATLALAALLFAPRILHAHAGDPTHLHVGILHPWLQAGHVQLGLILLSAAAGSLALSAVTRKRGWVRVSGLLAGAALLVALA